MTNDSLLRTKTTKTDCNRVRVEARGGLHYIRGNSMPHFSLTYNLFENGRLEACRASHDEILKEWPELADLAALHLSNIDGAPMHAEANGWYWLAGYYQGSFGDRYHGGNSQPTRTADDCLEIFAKHCRVPIDEARKIANQIRAVAMAAPHSRNAVAKAECARVLNDMRPRWKAEAEACIAKHGLVVYGDNWIKAA